MATDLTVANTILAQLGGNRFARMTGAKQFVGSDKALVFQLPGNPGYVKDGINLVKIELTPLDEYNMIFYRERSGKLTEKAKVEGVYCDQLQELFTEYTGLHTHF